MSHRPHPHPCSPYPTLRSMDPAPFVTLRLTDTEETRAMWPHRFELLYKVRVLVHACMGCATVRWCCWGGWGAAAAAAGTGGWA